ncbi:TetR family transcriptional regulator [Pseudoduganella lurida]|uniref:TetR family transcriptional regulator n=1 Tax=Pseudoduganella lurida TaxID=1036180 RepID=A0A562RME9_9BURK|nr:TetR/AcrR family transcriptional regulator [Pseudoduganella lurida]TWI69630.1 TetR family transcriptional regulator [Pseudoduganella lurida]
MKVTREQAAQNRERIVDGAARLFREKGFEGIGVADLMKSAGLTHGGFYGHFESKEALLAEAAGRALAGSEERWRGLIDTHPDDALGAIARAYLTPSHRDNPGIGCAFSALGADVARAGPAVREVVTKRTDAALDLLAAAMGDGTHDERRRRAMVAYAAMIGALVMSRAVADPVLSADILAAVAASLTAEPVSTLGSDPDMDTGSTAGSVT